jgi:hypothetical protein
MQPQRLIVPLFQRPYVWKEENQWRPLWKDMLRVDLLQQYVDQTSSDVEEEFDDEDDTDEGEDLLHSQVQSDIPNEHESRSGVVVDDRS